MSADATRNPDLTEAGDLVKIEYDLWAEGGGKTELLDTTHEETARTADPAATEGRTWGPRPHQIGGEYFPTGIENSLVGLKVGDEVQREFAPQDAFGERDPNLIELFSMHEIQRLPEMRREDAHLDLGTVLTINGRRGRVVTLTAARVRVDFNPPFAGRKVKGTFKVLEKIADPAEQVRAILELQYGRSAEFHVEVHDKTVTLRVPDRSKFDIGWMAAKPRVIDRLRSQLKPHTIRVLEEYVTPVAEKPEKDEKPKEAEAALAEAAASPEPTPAEPSKPPRTAKGGHKGGPKAAAGDAKTE
jgi:FKBP-type peptidyl-prolyl cis-trans isomerase 2